MHRSLVRILGFIFRPAIRFIVPRVNVDDPWEPTVYEPPYDRFGAGSRRRFSWYFEGESRVKVDRPEDVFVWLETCDYVSDEELFREADFWQHPTTFETTRSGDCEDHALWAWRKLSELGIAAEFFAGSLRDEDGSVKDRGHAWVVFEMEGQRYLLEPASNSREGMVRPLCDVRDKYLPAVSVDASYRTKSYRGWFAIRAAELDRS